MLIIKSTLSFDISDGVLPLSCGHDWKPDLIQIISLLLQMKASYFTNQPSFCLVCKKSGSKFQETDIFTSIFHTKMAKRNDQIGDLKNTSTSDQNKKTEQKWLGKECNWNLMVVPFTLKPSRRDRNCMWNNVLWQYTDVTTTTYIHQSYWIKLSCHFMISFSSVTFSRMIGKRGILSVWFLLHAVD